MMDGHHLHSKGSKARTNSSRSSSRESSKGNRQLATLEPDRCQRLSNLPSVCWTRTRVLEIRLKIRDFNG